MFTLRPDLPAALARAQSSTEHAPGAWFDRPPAGAHAVLRKVALPDDISVPACGQALLDFEMHRRAGLRVEAERPVRPGGTVVVGVHAGPLWVLSPCRVIEVLQEPDRAGFTYAALPGHPVRGIERFVYVRDGQGARFEVSAVSTPAFWGSRLVPFAARKVQALMTERYLRAAETIAAENASRDT